MAPKRLPTFVIAFAWLMTLVVLSNLPVGQCKAGVTVLSDTGSDIYARCKSADDEIGLKLLPYGQMLHWSFRPNFQMTTLYWCNFSWYSPAAGQTVFATFDVWSVNVIRNYLHDSAAWKVEKDGFYFYVVIKQYWELRHVWSANHTAVDDAVPTELMRI